MSIKERIYLYLNNKGITPTRAERELGWSVGALTKAKSITAERLKEFILLYSDLSTEWLLRNSGEMLLVVSSEEASTNTASQEIEELKAEINQLKGENRIMREMLNLNREGAGEHTKIA
ncbi:MAG: hypothetical protein MR321_05410 [Bacteroides sp.]|jgi:hypothetical protein|nr:hypothetical protein [Bacteroides sp.]MDD6909500.1 hypothetical protein [Bacteroidaceae bacterium]